MNDSFFMQRCVELAKLGSGRVAPNPMVGAVLVYKGEIIGEGYHEYYGGAHAEVNCLMSVRQQKSDLIAQSRLYVSLEPCNHFGKTPPCTDLILKNRIPEVTIGCIDRNALVSGAGVQRLKDAGVKVVTGVLEKECMELNKRFFTNQVFQRPYVILKWAQTSNGIIGDPAGRLHISNAYTNILVHKWRSEEQAVLVGCRTAIADDPLLTNRYGSGNQPTRIILCNKLPRKRLNMYAQDGTTIVFNTEVDDTHSNVLMKKVNSAGYLQEVLSVLYKMHIQSILVEGGSFTLQQFFDSGYWDECRIITNMQLAKDVGIPAPTLPSMHLHATQTVLSDLIQYFANTQNNFVVHNELTDYF